MPDTTIKKVEAGSSPRPQPDVGLRNVGNIFVFSVVVTDSSKVDACACVEQVKTV